MLTSTNEAGVRTIDNATNFLHVVGEFVQSAWAFGVENAKNKALGVGFTVIVVGAIVLLPEEILVAFAVGAFAGITALFNNNSKNKEN